MIGVEGLRVADSSIFPRITNGNLNGPSIMVGEKASDHILGRTPLACSIRSLGSIRAGKFPTADKI